MDDRRKSNRQPVLIRTAATLGRDRLEVVCINTSPTGAFFTTRHPPPVGAELVIEFRADGVDSPLVYLHGLVVRTALTGAQEPVGFGVEWRRAQCDLGPEPLFRLLRQVLHIAVPGTAGMQSDGMLAEYDFAAPPVAVVQEDPHQRTPRTAPMPTISRNSSVHQALGVWSPPLHRSSGAREGGAADAQRPTGPNLHNHPAQHPVELEPPPAQPSHSAAHASRSAAQPSQPARAARAESAPVSALSPPTRLEPVRVGVAPTDHEPILHDFSEVFDSLTPEASAPVGRRLDDSQPGRDNASQSWPVYALAPGERRLVSDPELAAHPPRPLQPSAAHHANGNVQTESIAPPPRVVHSQAPAAQPHPSPHPAPHAPSQPVQPVVAHAAHVPASRPVAAAAPPAGPAHRRSESGALLTPVDVPVTVLRQHQLITGQLTGIAEQLACVVTRDAAPDLDEPLVIHLPVRVAQTWRTVQLSGKLLQIPADTSAGKRFVMHIERVEEGRHKGAFRDFLHAVGGL